MRKTLLATTAAASLLAFGATAQQAPDPAAPSAPAPMVPADPATPAAPADAVPDAMMPTAPSAAQGTDAAAPAATPLENAATPLLTPVEAAEISADALIGATIQTPSGDNIAQVDDVLMRPEGGVESVVAQFGGFLGFGSSKVLLSMDEIEVMKDETGAFVVQTSLTPESLEGRPEYQSEN